MALTVSSLSASDRLLTLHCRTSPRQAEVQVRVENRRPRRQIRLVMPTGMRLQRGEVENGVRVVHQMMSTYIDQRLDSKMSFGFDGDLAPICSDLPSTRSKEWSNSWRMANVSAANALLGRVTIFLMSN